jgi:ribonuclease BN (tRNA processing enzyme)
VLFRSQNPNFSIHIAGANDPERSLKEMAQSAFYSSYSLAKQPPKAKIDLYELLEDNYELMPGIKLTTMYANHPTSTLIYILEMFGKKIVYAPDSEIWGEATALQDYDERLGIFSKDADIFIHDVNYNDKDYEIHNHEGHSGLSIVLDFANKANIRNLVLFHLNHGYSDETLDKMYLEAQNIVKTKGYTLNCHMAAESKTFLL